MNPDLTQMIRNLEMELLRPETRKSAERLNELLAGEFVEIGSSGKRYSKEEVMKLLPGSAGVKYTMQDFRAVEISPHTVLATYRAGKETAQSGRQSWSLRSSIWQHREGRWQILFHQGTTEQ